MCHKVRMAPVQCHRNAVPQSLLQLKLNAENTLGHPAERNISSGPPVHGTEKARRIGGGGGGGVPYCLLGELACGRALDPERALRYRPSPASCVDLRELRTPPTGQAEASVTELNSTPQGRIAPTVDRHQWGVGWRQRPGAACCVS